MKLLNVEVQDFLKVELVEFSPGDGATLLAGENEQGKSSTIKAIIAALGGEKLVPADPVRHGADSSKTKLVLGEDGQAMFTIEHKLQKKDGETLRTLIVRNAKGVKEKSPQGVLNALLNRIAFDPLAFTRAKAEDQDRILKDLAGVTDDFARLDGEHTTIYDVRTEKNREHKAALARAAGMPEHFQIPKQEVSVTSLAEKLAAAREQAHARRNAEDAIRRQQADVERALNHVEQLKAQVRAAEDKYREETALLDSHTKALAELPDAIDTTDLEQSLATAEETNRKVRENAARKAEEKRAEALEAESAALTKQLEAINAEKQKILERAKFPVEGLGFNDLGPTLNGVPLADASTARMIDLSVAIGIAQHPQLKLLLIREGSFLDDNALKRIDARAREAGAQLLIERVGTKDTGANVVIIENGLSKAATAAE